MLDGKIVDMQDVKRDQPSGIIQPEVKVLTVIVGRPWSPDAYDYPNKELFDIAWREWEDTAAAFDQLHIGGNYELSIFQERDGTRFPPNGQSKYTILDSLSEDLNTWKPGYIWEYIPISTEVAKHLGEICKPEQSFSELIEELTQKLDDEKGERNGGQTQTSG